MIRLTRLILLACLSVVAAGCSIQPIQKEENTTLSSYNTTSKASTKPSPPLILEKEDKLIYKAINYLGTPYKYGGNTAVEGFDCSSFVRHVYKESVNINLPRVSADQSRKGKKVTFKNMKKGDLIFFKVKSRRVNHVGMYMGDGTFIHAPSTGKVIRIESINKAYWKNKIVTIRRHI